MVVAQRGCSVSILLLVLASGAVPGSAAREHRRQRLRISAHHAGDGESLMLKTAFIDLGSGAVLRRGERALRLLGRRATDGDPSVAFSPRQQIAVPTGAGVPAVTGTNLPRLTGSQDTYYSWVSNATLVPPGNNFAVLTGKDPEDMTDMERKVLVAQKALQQLEASQKVEASTVEARFEMERNEVMGLMEKKRMETQRVFEQEAKVAQLKQEINDMFRELQRRDMLKRDPALTDSCAPGFHIYFSVSVEQKLGRDDKRVVSKALKDQYCDLKDLSCLCDIKQKWKKNRPLSSLGSVRDRLDCNCATKLADRYRAPKDVDDLLVRLGHRNLVAASAIKQENSPPPAGSEAGTPGSL